MILGILSFFWKGKDKEDVEVAEEIQIPILDVIYKEQVVNAVRKFSEQLPKGTYRTILVNDDYSIDFTQLYPTHLRGIPAQNFYMSKETYDIFEEHEKHIPELMDKVQKAVDQYVKENKKPPILPFDPLRKVNSYLLIQEKLLDSAPEIEFFITDYDGLITHFKPDSQK
jgi:hypothetical protein